MVSVVFLEIVSRYMDDADQDTTLGPPCSHLKGGYMMDYYGMYLGNTVAVRRARRNLTSTWIEMEKFLSHAYRVSKKDKTTVRSRQEVNKFL